MAIKKQLQNNMKNNIDKIIHDKLSLHLNEQLKSKAKAAADKATEKLKNFQKSLTPNQTSGLPDWIKQFPCLSDRGTLIKRTKDDGVTWISDDKTNRQIFYKNMIFLLYDNKSGKKLADGSWVCKDGKLVITANGKQWTKATGKWETAPNTTSGSTTSTGSTTTSTGTTNNTQTKKVSKYKKCSEELPIKQWCKNKTIQRVQACLKMPKKYWTGNFGPITQGYLESRDQNGTLITTETIYNVCSQNDPLGPNATNNTGSGTSNNTGSGTSNNTGSGTSNNTGSGMSNTSTKVSKTGYEDYTFDEVETGPQEKKKFTPSPESPEGEGTGYEGYSDENSTSTNQKPTPPVSSDIRGLQSSKKSFYNPMSADDNED